MPCGFTYKNLYFLSVSTRIQRVKMTADLSDRRLMNIHEQRAVLKLPLILINYYLRYVSDNKHR